jgi:hypothetical protein
MHPSKTTDFAKPMFANVIVGRRIVVPRVWLKANTTLVIIWNLLVVPYSIVAPLPPDGLRGFDSQCL